MKPINRILSLLWGCCGLLFLRTSVGDASESTPSGENLDYCPYFENRGPSKQDNLRNCTWYKENSCCHDAEIEFAFQQLTPLVGASDNCVQYLNYLYCYICAPNQNSFFKDHTLTVCEEFCDDVYVACKNAALKGRKIKHIYKNGEEFCKSRRFQTDKKANKKCFTFDAEEGTKSRSERIALDGVFLALGGLFTVFANLYVFG